MISPGPSPSALRAYVKTEPACGATRTICAYEKAVKAIATVATT